MISTFYLEQNFLSFSYEKDFSALSNIRPTRNKEHVTWRFIIIRASQLCLAILNFYFHLSWRLCKFTEIQRDVILVYYIINHVLSSMHLTKQTLKCKLPTQMMFCAKHHSFQECYHDLGTELGFSQSIMTLHFGLKNIEQPYSRRLIE